MKKKTKHRKDKEHPVIRERLNQKKKARSLGYEKVEDYERGLSTVRRLLAEKDKKPD